MRLKPHRLALLCGVLTTIATAPSSAAQRYAAEDARYVTSSKNPAVLEYIVCLHAEVGSTPRNVSIPDALAGAAKSCERLAQRLPGTPGEPDAETIQQSILECGFRPGDASPDADCDQRTDSGTTHPGAAGGAPPLSTQGAASSPVVLTPTSSIALGKGVEGIAYDGKWLWVAESGQRTVARVDLASGRVVDRVKVGRLPVAMVSAGDGNVFAMVNTDKIIWRQASDGRRTTLARLGECPESMIGAERELWALTWPDCSSEKSRVIRIDPVDGRQTQSPILGQWAMALTAHGPQIWVAHGSEPALTLVDRQSLKATPITVGGASLFAITANSRHVFAGGRVEGGADNDGLVVMFDPVRATALHRAPVSQRVAELLSDEEHVVAIGDQGTIWVFSADDLTLLRTIRLSTGAFDPRSAIFHDGAMLIASSVEGGQSAVLVIEGWRPGGHSSNQRS